MTPNPRPWYHARGLILGLGGLVVMWGGVLLTSQGGVHTHEHQASDLTGPLVAAVLGTVALLAITWLGWIDLMSALSLSIDEKAISIGWPTRRVVPWADVTSVQRSVGTLRLVVKTKGATERVQMLVDRTPPKTLTKLVRAVQRAGGRVEEYLLKLADYVEDTPDED
jgi:hypothetical protein